MDSNSSSNSNNRLIVEKLVIAEGLPPLIASLVLVHYLGHILVTMDEEYASSYSEEDEEVSVNIFYR